MTRGGSRRADSDRARKIYAQLYGTAAPSRPFSSMSDKSHPPRERRAFLLLAPFPFVNSNRNYIWKYGADLPFINRFRSSHIVYHYRSLRLLNNVIGITVFALGIRKRDYRE